MAEKRDQPITRWPSTTTQWTEEQLNPDIRERWHDWDAADWIDGAIERFCEEIEVQAGMS